MTSIPAELEQAVDRVVRRLWHLQKSDADDLKQELYLRLLKIKDLSAAKAQVRVIARGLLWNLRREEELRGKLHKAISNSEPWIKSNDFWFPEYYPPHKDAKEFAPFACSGARVMSVHERGGKLNTLQDTVFALLFSARLKRRIEAKKAMKRRVKNKALDGSS